MIYEDRAVAFVDILGFKDIIASTIEQNGNEIEEETKKLNSFFDEVNKEFSSEEKWTSIPDTCTRIVTHFSDSIVFSVKATQKDGVLFLLDYIHYLIIIAIHYGFLIRGGITYGKVCHTEDKIFGPAMNASYLMESNEAKFPRIVIHEDVLRATFKNRGPQADEDDVVKYLSHLVQKDTDGVFYLDYFSNVINGYEYAIDKYNYSQKIISIIDNLDTKINSLSDEALKINLNSKSSWLKTKFNELLEEQKSIYSAEEYDDDEFSELKSYFMKLHPYNVSQ